MLEQKRTCHNCTKGTVITINGDILCKINGVVSPDYVCSSHRFIPTEKTYKQLNYKCTDCENFVEVIASQRNNIVYGTCQLFSIRKFEGANRSACSKFVRKKKVELYSQGSG